MDDDAPLTPLPPELKALLAAEQQRPGLSADATERIRARLATSIASPPPRRCWPTAIGSFLVGLLVGGGLATGLLLGRLPPPAPKLLVLDAPPPAVIVVAAAPAIPPVPPPTPPAPSSRHGGVRAERASANQPAPAAKDDRDTDLARERALIETARTALSRQQADAIDLLLRHEQQFPRGRLAEERESLLVQALLQAGRIDEARRRGARFRARFPRSLLLPVVDAALRSIP